MALRKKVIVPAVAGAEVTEDQDLEVEEYVEDEAETEGDSTEAPVTEEAKLSPTPEAVVAVAVNEKQPTVRVKVKNDLRTFIGDTWYNFKAGVEQPVPLNVKEILKRAGQLDAL